MERAQLEAILQKELSGQKDSCGRGEWTLDHCLRTAHIAVRLRQLTGKSAKLDDLIYTAGLFHDIAHDSTAHDQHEAAGAQRTEELLKEILPAAFLKRVTAIIAVHDDRRPNDGRDDATCLVQDADLLDHFGTARIWAEFGFAAKHGMRLEQSLCRLMLSQRKRGLYCQILHFDVSRREIIRRLDYETMFAELACAESCGEFRLEESAEKGAGEDAENQCTG